MARVVLDRAAQTTAELGEAFKGMSAFDKDAACSAPAIEVMRRIDLSSSMLQGVGYIANGNLKCSSFGEDAKVRVGTPDYISATNTQFRRHRTLSIAPDAPVLMVSDAQGHTGFIHPSLVFNLSDRDGLPAGVVSFSTREEIIFIGPHNFEWHLAPMPQGQFSGVLTMGSRLVAWSRSPVWDHFTYAAVPFAAVWDEFKSLLAYFLPVGALIGTLLMVVVHRISASRTSLPNLLRAGLSRKEVFAVYQPIVDMRTGQWVGAEVLARWQRPGGEQISPDVFVPIAEKHGLIGELTRRMISAAASEFWSLAAARQDFFVSINITSIDLQNPRFVDEIVSVCDEHGIAHSRLHLEITERAQVDPQGETETIRALRAKGFAVGIDDFGVGYSNLAYLDTLDVDYLKIDRLFVAGLSAGGIGSQVVDHIITLGGDRGLILIAEGVETEGQRAALVSRGVKLGQGWLFGKPMVQSDFALAHTENLTVRADDSAPVALSRVA